MRSLPLIIIISILAGFAQPSFGSSQTPDSSGVVSQASPTTAADCVELGNELRLKGHTEQAIEAYRKAIELDPKHEQAYLELAGTLRAAGKGVEQISILYSGQQLIPASSSILRNLMNALYQDNRDSEAVDIGRKYLVLQPKDALLMSFVGSAYCRMKQYDNAIDWFERAIAIDDKLAFPWFSIGTIHHINGRYEDALAAYQHIIDSMPNDPLRQDVWSLKMTLFMSTGRINETTEEVERELASDPKSYRALFARSILKLAQNRPEEAIADLTRALSLADNDSFRSYLYTAMGSCQIAISHYQEAIEYLKKSIELVPDNATAHAMLATAYVKSSDYEKAFDSLDKAIHSTIPSPSELGGFNFNAMAFNNLAVCLVGLKRFDDAEKAVRYAVQFDPAEPRLHMTLVGVLMAQQKTKEVERELRSIVKQSSDWRVPMLLGSLYVGQKRLEEAIPAFRQAFKLKPDDPGIMNDLGYSLLELDKDIEEALDLIKRAVKAMPSNASFRDSLGWAYYKSGNLAEAEKELLQAAKGNLKSGVVFEHLGDLYQKMEKKADALSYWKSALDLAKDEETKIRLESKISGLH